MLVRVGGGTAGIKQYLEDGRKQGRGQTRDELDERVILSGDLEITDLVIDHFDSAGDKYWHVTLSFKEDEISRETLQAITEEFRQFAFAAYRDDEYTFYAEAHLPRIKSYLDARSGEVVERKPHIHIVIPLSNALSGTRLEPFGVVDKQIRYLDAWQEHINDKYGLASPKHNRRVEFTSESEVISRHKGDLFDSQGKVLKADILQALLDRDVRDLQAFRDLLEQFGERRTRNAGQPLEYENLKPPGAVRGINLKDWVFSREFIELPLLVKREQLIRRMDQRPKPTYEAAGHARATSAERLQLLQEWAHTRAREIKYLNSGNRRAWREYQAADPDGRSAILDARQARFYAQHDPENSHDRSPGAEPASAQARAPRRGRRAHHPLDGRGQYPLKNGRPEPAAGQHDPGAAAQLSQAQSLHRLRNLSSLDVVRDAEDRALLLPGDAAHQLEHRRAHRDDALRRHAPGEPGSSPGLGAEFGGEGGRGGRSSDSVAGQHLRDSREARIQARAAELQAWRDLRASIQATGLLADLSRSHGLQVDKYNVVQGPDGSDRIRCGARSLNVSDFLTKELHLPWDQALQILRDSLQRQLERDPTRTPIAAPRPGLWRAFNRERWLGITARRDQTQLGTRKSREAITLAYRQARTQAGTLPPAQRRAAISVARMTRVQAEQQLRDHVRQHRAQVRARIGTPALDQYRSYLQERAGRGDAQALAELRRVAPAAPQRQADAAGQLDPVAGWILAGDDDQARRARAALYTQVGLAYTVARNGDVTYQLQGRAMIRDTARQIDVLSHHADVIDSALRLAQQKFGQTLTLSGSKTWQEKVALTAGERGIRVSFTDQRLNLLVVSRGQEVARQAREAQNKPRDQDRDQSLER